SPYHRAVKSVISSAQMREIDLKTTELFGVPSLLLMENAAGAISRTVAELSGVADESILVRCGPGNNGGDGAAAARLLAQCGAKVDVVLFGKLDDTKEDARSNFIKAKSPDRDVCLRFFECASTEQWSALQLDELAKPYTVVIDALFGTGLTRQVEGVYREAISYMLQLRRQDDEDSKRRPAIISIDIPSGLNADSAQPMGMAVESDITVTMTSPKAANVLPPAANYNGALIVADIGSPAELIHKAGSRLFLSEEADARKWLIKTRYTSDSYKNSHGHVLVIAGSRGFTGAAALCGNAAMRSGAGLVTVGTPASAQPLVATQVMPEVMTAALAETDRGTVSNEALSHVLKLAERANVIALGPGLSSEEEQTRDFVRQLVEQRRTPMVVDADGLNCLAPWPAGLGGSTAFPVILTPHPGEMLRLIGSNDKSAIDDRVTVAREFAIAHDVIVVLKGTRPLIAAPDGRVFVNPTGNPGLGTAGAGDTLTGVIAGFLAQAYGTLKQHADALETVIAALYIGGLAGDLAAEEIGMRSMVASDIRDHLAAAVCALDAEGEMP
ncbi:MAG: ADP-dependent NAD(P)H-hydrate dehydratase / NAD(P)H-hydrate epimerase, partial [Blastocatellia bacterium]|nr:ADP-dependent NAD(P)H-hydrate dehydratase / NAD(P)H-hydrate epimerase [Blastocatellia bacterium]